VLGHGRTNAKLLRPMWEQDEARAIKECTEIIEKYVGVRPTGWMGPGALEPNVTPDLLKEAGYTHLLDCHSMTNRSGCRSARDLCLRCPIPWN